MSEWKPIETAPKDGTEILIGWMARDGRRRGGWICKIRRWRDDAGWRRDRNHPYDLYPTHWMPLPEPPASNPKDYPA